MKKIDHLPPRRQRFVREYALDGNGTQAAIRAGFAERSAYQTAHVLLKNADVQSALAELQDQTAARLDLTRDQIVAELWRNHLVAFEGMPVFDKSGNDTGARNRSLTASNRALEIIAQLLGFAIDRKSILVANVADMSDAELDRQEAMLKAELVKLEAVGGQKQQDAAL